MWWSNRRYIATRPFIIGMNNTRVQKGTSVFFDGVTVRYGVDRFSCPEFAAAKQHGWVVPWYRYRKNNPNYGRPEAAPITLTTASRSHMRMLMPDDPSMAELDKDLIGFFNSMREDPVEATE
jgi:hypothetical protein